MMAYPTIEQKDVVSHLVTEYGVPDRMAIEMTSKPYGIMWLRWDGEQHGILSRFADRNLFINPDGERLSWKQLK